MRDLSRVDFLVAPDGEFVVLEVSAVPGMTATSLFPFSVQAERGSFSSTLGSLLEAVITRTQWSRRVQQDGPTGAQADRLRWW